MSRSTIWIILRTLGLLIGVGVAYVVFKDPFKAAEARASINVLVWCSGGAYRHNLAFDPPSSIIVTPQATTPFIAIVSYSCSSFASALSLLVLGTVTPRTPHFRRVIGTVVAVATVVLGNLARISLSLLVGIYHGRASLVLFHDWVGSTFTFIYTLGGFIVMLLILSPAKRRGRDFPASSAAGTASNPAPSPAH